MKLLVVGDFHGRFPRKLLRVIKKEKINALVSNGDYLPFSLRKVFFERCYQQELELWEAIGKKKVKEFIRKDVAAGARVLKELNSLSIPAITVLGNVDHGKWGDAIDCEKVKWLWYEQDFLSPIIKKFKHIQYIDYSWTRLGEFVFIGGGPSSFPGHVKSKMYKKLRKILDRLFQSHKHKKIIFLSHNVPYNMKLDKITSKKAHEKALGKHYGSKLVRRIIDRYHPVLALGGHIHEGRGMQKFGKTLVVNPGAIHEGHYAIVEIVGKKVKVKLR